MEVLAVNQKRNDTVDVVQLSASRPDSGSTVMSSEFPRRGGCIFFIENDHHHHHHHHHYGDNSKVGVDLVKK